MKKALELIGKLTERKTIGAFVYTRIDGKEILKLNARDVTLEDMDIFDGCEIIADGDHAWRHTISIAL